MVEYLVEYLVLQLVEKKVFLMVVKMAALMEY